LADSLALQVAPGSTKRQYLHYAVGFYPIAEADGVV